MDVSAVSGTGSQQVNLEAQVRVFKKQQDSDARIAATLIDAAAQSAPPPPRPDGSRLLAIA